MFKNYFKIAFRNLYRYKTFSFINIFGLAVGMACTILIMLWVQNELSFDRFNKNADRTYKVNRNFYNRDGSVSIRLRYVAPTIEPLLENDFPDIEYSARVKGYSTIVNFGDTHFTEVVFFAEQEIFNILSFEGVNGNFYKAMAQPNMAVITEEIALKYFGNKESVGKYITLEDEQGKQNSIQIAGIIKSLPENSSWRPNILLSFATFTSFFEEDELTKWSSNNYSTYIMLKENFDAKILASQLDDFIIRHLGENSTLWTRLEIQNISDVHFDGDYTSIYVISGLSLFLLLIASINFMNLSTARSMRRAKEVGIRKTLGGYKIQLIKQFLTESVLISSISLLLAVLIVKLALPSFNQLIDRQLTLNIFDNVNVILQLLTLILIVGIFAGLYPSLYLSSFTPVAILKNNFEKKNSGFSFRNILVVSQFTISIFLIICVGVINNQLNFVMNKKLGYNKEHIVRIYSNQEIYNSYETVKQQLLENPNIVNVSAGSVIPSNELNSFSGARVIKSSKSEPIASSIFNIRVDHNYFKTFGIKLLAGRDFSIDMPTDYNEAFILNECAVRKIGWASPMEAIGKEFGYGDKNGRIIGVVNDFNFESLHNEIAPMVFVLTKTDLWNIVAKIKPENIAGTIGFIENIWKEISPKRGFEFSFLDDELNKKYFDETRTQKVFNITAVIAILIACLGLFGLAAYTVEQRTKEIGIRKVLGATNTNIVYMLSNKFSKWVLISNFFAMPLAYFAMNKWLENFAYKVEIGVGVFIFAGLTALIVALLTVSYQAIKAALANPVESLRND